MLGGKAHCESQARLLSSSLTKRGLASGTSVSALALISLTSEFNFWVRSVSAFQDLQSQMSWWGGGGEAASQSLSASRPAFGFASGWTPFRDPRAWVAAPGGQSLDPDALAGMHFG